MRVLISIVPRSYRESLALAIHRYRPLLEDVFVIAPQDLDGHLEELRPQLVVSNEVPEEAREETFCWVEILFRNSLHAEVYLKGRSYEIEDVSIADILSIIDECSL